MPFVNDQELSPTQVTQLTQAMLSVAVVDGIHPAEAALIGQFYESSRSPDMPTAAAVLAKAEATVFDPKDLATASPAFADTLVLMCLMTGYADGKLSASELAHVATLSAAAGMDQARFDALLAQVQDELLGALSSLPDANSVASVLKELAPQ